MTPRTSPPDLSGRRGLNQIQGTRRIVAVMGTVFSIDLRDLHPGADAVDEVVAWWRWVDRTFSTYRLDSEISRLVDGSLRPSDCAPEVRHVLDLCAQASRASGGYFTDRPRGRLDPSGMVKGWSAEVASGVLLQAGSAHHCITAGGDVQCAGRPAAGEVWRIGVVDPSDPQRLLAVVAASETPRLAVATSGTAERGLHVIDPSTGSPAAELASLTVVASDLTLADWTATAAFAMGHDSRPWLEQTDGVEAYAVTPRGDYWCTSGFAQRGQILTAPLDC